MGEPVTRTVTFLPRPGGLVLHKYAIGAAVGFALLVAFALGAGAVWHLKASVIFTVLFLAVLAGALPGSMSARIVLTAVAVLLTGYALGGRGFAYLGFPPVYIGEIVLGLVCVISLTAGTLQCGFRCAGLPLLIFLLWCLTRTVPDVLVYGINAVRDAAIWGYAAFALAVAGALLRFGQAQLLIAWYRALLTPLLGWFFLLALVSITESSLQFPAGPNGVPLVVVKPGDVAVHLAGAASFLALRLHRCHLVNAAHVWWSDSQLWSLWITCFLFYGSQNRGGLFGLLASLAFLAVVLRKGSWRKAAISMLIVLISFGTLNLEFEKLQHRRKATLQQILVNLKSIAGSEDPSLEGTRRWRLQWWRKILGYTVRGPYLLTGKGFGPNLADEDGFQVTRDGSLRSPHNGHLTILARTGAPGFMLWCWFLVDHGLALLRRQRQLRIAGDCVRSRVILWVLTYWIAATINGASDVYLEGPQGGIWFWCLVGVGRVLSCSQPARTDASSRFSSTREVLACS